MAYHRAERLSCLGPRHMISKASHSLALVLFFRRRAGENRETHDMPWRLIPIVTSSVETPTPVSSPGRHRVSRRRDIPPCGKNRVRVDSGAERAEARSRPRVASRPGCGPMAAGGAGSDSANGGAQDRWWPAARRTGLTPAPVDLAASPRNLGAAPRPPGPSRS